MKKSDLVSVVAKEVGLTLATASDAVNVMFDTIQAALVKGEEVSISNFGKFSVSESAARQGVNPRTGDKIQIPAKTRARFKASSKLVG